MSSASNLDAPRRVLLVGTWDEGAGYPRTRGLVQGLEHDGVHVERLRAELPDLGVGGKSKFLRSPWRWLGFGLGLRRCKHELQSALRARLANGARPDAVLVPYPGHLAVQWIRPVCEAVGVPVILDLFLSAWGTAVEDRGLFRPWSPLAAALGWLDRAACRAADVVLMDTKAHAEAVAARVGDLPRGRFDWVPITDPDAVALDPAGDRDAVTPLRVLFFGTGVALHGLEHLVDAVAQSPRVHLTLVGGTKRERAHARAVVPAAQLELGEWFEPMPQLRERMARADLIAGIFGTSNKARQVVPFKVVHALGAGRPTLTADTRAVRTVLTPGRDCFVCPAGDARQIAAALDVIADLSADGLGRVGAAGRAVFESAFSTASLATRLRAILDECVQPATPDKAVPAAPIALTT